MKREPKVKQCKNCEGTFMQYKSTQVVCCTACAIAYAKHKAYTRELKRARKERKEWYEENATIQDLIKKAQKAFNAFIRERDRGKPCISCSGKLGAKYDAGHYYNANNHYSVRFDERNVHAQCVRCNRDLHGNLINYRSGLINIIGESELAKLDSIAYKTRHFERSELIDLESHYKSKKNFLYKNEE